MIITHSCPTFYTYFRYCLFVCSLNRKRKQPWVCIVNKMVLFLTKKAVYNLQSNVGGEGDCSAKIFPLLKLLLWKECTLRYVCQKQNISRNFHNISNIQTNTISLFIECLPSYITMHIKHLSKWTKCANSATVQWCFIRWTLIWPYPGIKHIYLIFMKKISHSLMLEPNLLVGFMAFAIIVVLQSLSIGPGLTHISLVCCPGPFVVLCEYY